MAKAEDVRAPDERILKDMARAEGAEEVVVLWGPALEGDVLVASLRLPREGTLQKG